MPVCIVQNTFIEVIRIFAYVASLAHLGASISTSHGRVRGRLVKRSDVFLHNRYWALRKAPFKSERGRITSCEDLPGLACQAERLRCSGLPVVEALRVECSASAIMSFPTGDGVNVVTSVAHG